MRILLLTQFYQPEPMFKGAPFASALRERGHSVEVITGFPNYPGGRLYPGYRTRPYMREHIDGTPVLRLPLYPSHNTSGIQRAANYLSFASSVLVGAPILAKKPDVIYVYNLVTLMPAARLLRYWYGCPILLDVQDLWPESISSSGMVRSGAIMRILERFCSQNYRAADRLTVLSPGFKRYLIGRGVPDARIEVVYNWCDERPLNPGILSGSTLKMAKGMGGRFNVLFAGTMGKVQALDTVLTAAKLLKDRLPDVLFTFLGGGVDVGRLSRAAATSSNIQFLPKCCPAEALAIIKEADAVLVHLKREPLFSITIPSKTQAYLHIGRPILMGVEGDAAELVRAAEAGICFSPENAESLAEAVTWLCSIPEASRIRMGENGRGFYTRELALDKGVQKFEAIMRSMIETARKL